MSRLEAEVVVCVCVCVCVCEWFVMLCTGWGLWGVEVVVCVCVCVYCFACMCCRVAIVDVTAIVPWASSTPDC